MSKRIICVSMCFFIFMTLFLPGKVNAITSDGEANIPGIDVSNWQGYIDYTAVKNSGIQIVYIKASQGTGFKDPYLEYNYKNAKDNGLKVGFYHYVTATSVQSAEREAQFFASVISGKSPDCKLAMDFEVFDSSLSVAQINEISLAFLSKLKQLTGKDVVVYSNLYTSQTVFDQSVSSRYPLWLAYYGDYTRLTNTFSNWNNWIGVQYTSKRKS
ncbi:MAG: hypothetical protein IKG42_01240 [Clostridia bacterium]|nr:hypothetical protein [Clostridia bacterium]